MNDGLKLAMAIMILFIAMIAFFFAFHPGGVQGVSDPTTMLQWLMGQYTTATKGPGSTSNTSTSSSTNTGSSGG